MTRREQFWDDLLSWRMVAAAGVVLAAFSILLSVLLFDHIQDLRESRVQDQARTDRSICERQETVTERLIDTKEKQIRTDQRTRPIAAREALNDE